MFAGFFQGIEVALATNATLELTVDRLNIVRWFVEGIYYFFELLLGSGSENKIRTGSNKA
jgi:hypothetical protein